jgi:subfamily B ATP-binding cassette protein MsbA
LHEIDLAIQPGEALALVGPSGAGKSTVFNLIPRFYDPTDGQVCIDGYDVREVTLESLRMQIGIVQQEVQLFAGTVRENLRYGKLEATDAELETAARAANAEEFIARLPNGYDTVVGERGVKLSGGQRQRIAIARAILKNPRILLLDEATSSLDSESEGLVQEALERLMKDRTTVIIAHRLSTVHHANRIAVLDQGRLVELGDHAGLMARDGLYARLYNMQFQNNHDNEKDGR